MSETGEYRYHDASAPWLEAELWPALRHALAVCGASPGRVFELGCGNGATAAMLAGLGYEAVGVDPSVSGIEAGRRAFPGVTLDVADSGDDLAARYGRFPLVVSLEVIEHCYDPRGFARRLHDLLQDDGRALVSTPYHGYWKNLALALAGRWDAHLDPLWDHGHIKFFSVATLTRLMREAGLEVCRIDRVGRIPPLAKSMLMTLRRAG